MISAWDFTDLSIWIRKGPLAGQVSLVLPFANDELTVESRTYQPCIF